MDGKDYIYDRKQQETLVGKKMQKRRNHFNAFIKEYGDRYAYHALSRADFSEVFECLKRWQTSHEAIFGIEEEEQGIRFLFDHFEELGLSGGVITIDGRNRSFFHRFSDHRLYAGHSCLKKQTDQYEAYMWLS